jgi:hypothetical protein
MSAVDAIRVPPPIKNASPITPTLPKTKTEVHPNIPNTTAEIPPPLATRATLTGLGLSQSAETKFKGKVFGRNTSFLNDLGILTDYYLFIIKKEKNLPRFQKTYEDEEG